MDENTHPAAADLQALCGPLFNAFTPAENAPDDRGGFFRPGAWVARPIEDEVERWDGLS